MKRHNHRILTVAAALALTLSLLLTACGSQPASSDAASAPASSAAASAPAEPAGSEAPASDPASSAASDSDAPEAQQIAITVSVVDGEGQSQDFTIETSQEFLRGALEEQDLIQGEETEYGLFVKTVNNITADDAQEQWWCFTKGGEMLETGVDTTPIADGDQFEATLTTGFGA